MALDHARRCSHVGAWPRWNCGWGLVGVGGVAHGTARLLHRHHQGHVGRVKRRIAAVHGQVHRAARGVGAVVQGVRHLALPHLLLQLHPPVLEPDLDLPLGQPESAGKLGPPASGEEVVEVELLLQLKDLLLRVHGPHPHQLRSGHRLLRRLAVGLAQSCQQRGVGGEGRHAGHPSEHSSGDQAVPRHHGEGGAVGRRGDASCPRRRPRTTFLNYDKDIIRVITGVQGASLRKPKTTQIVVFLFIQRNQQAQQVISPSSLLN